MLSTIRILNYNKAMNQTSGQPDIYWLLLQLAVRARHDFARLAEQHYGLTAIQLYTLSLLNAASPLPMNTISCQLACDASNVTGIVDRLTAQGLVRRQDDPHDRRHKLIALTPRGAELRALVMRDLQKFAPGSLTQLSPAEQQQLRSLLAKALAPPRS